MVSSQCTSNGRMEPIPLNRVSECSLASCLLNLIYPSLSGLFFSQNFRVWVWSGSSLHAGLLSRCSPWWEQGETSRGGATLLRECSDSRHYADQAGVTRCRLFGTAVLLAPSSCLLYPCLKHPPRNPQAKKLVVVSAEILFWVVEEYLITCCPFFGVSWM